MKSLVNIILAKKKRCEELSERKTILTIGKNYSNFHNMNEHCCPIACNPYKGDRECFFLEKNFHAHCLTCPSNGREQSLPSRALLVFDETNKFPSFHFFLYISRALLGLSHDARLRDTHIFLFHAHCLTCFTMRVCAIHIFLFYARCL